MFWRIVMCKLLKIEFKRAILNYRFLLSLIIGTSICYYGLTGYFSSNNAGLPINYINAYQAWFTALDQGNKSFFILVAPIICILPFTDSYFEDMQSGYLISIINRTSYEKYIKVKIIVNAIIGGVCCSLPTVITFIIAIVKYPMKLALVYSPSNSVPVVLGFFPEGIFSANYALHPLNYIIFCFIQIFLFGFVYSTFGMCACSLVQKRISALLIPFIYYIGFNTITGSLGVIQNSPYTTLMPWQAAATTYNSVYGQFFIIFAVSVICIRYFTKRRII
jgi:hypothetical protein